MGKAKVQIQIHPSYIQRLWLAAAYEQYALGRKIPKTCILVTVQKMEKRSSRKKTFSRGILSHQRHSL